MNKSNNAKPEHQINLFYSFENLFVQNFSPYISFIQSTLFQKGNVFHLFEKKGDKNRCLIFFFLQIKLKKKIVFSPSIKILLIKCLPKQK